MKINQIVGEHKKGFRAKKYAKKPTNTIAPKKPEPIKPQGPVGIDETGEAGQQAFQVQKSGPEGTTLVNPATKVQMQLPPEMAAQMVQDKNDPKQFNLSQQAVTPPVGGEANAKPAGPQMGDTVTLAGPTMGEEGEEEAMPVAPEATDGPAMGEVGSPYPSRNAGTPAADQAAQAQQEPTKPVQSAVYPSRNVKENRSADDALLKQMQTIAGLR